MAQQSVSMILSGDLAIWFWVGIVLIGLAVPIISEAIELSSHSSHKPAKDKKKSVDPTLKANLQHFSDKKESRTKLYLVEAATIIGGFSLRFIMIAAAVPINIIL